MDPVASSAASPGRRRWVPAIVGIVAVVTLAVAGWWFFTSGPGTAITSPAGSVVASYSGDADFTTDTFQVREGWSIHWATEGPHFEFAMTGDSDIGTLINEDEATNGITSPVPFGTYRLEISADGPWTVEIRQGS
jgi:hypothetical protein